MMHKVRFLRWFVRAVGTVALLAAIAVILPYSWMDHVHQWLGMGKLPSDPVVGYLARSTSAFYAILGGLLWVTSSDLRRHRPILQYLGLAMVLLGLTLGVVDWVEGMPLWWRLAEGPTTVVVGLFILLFSL
ncbi:MAG: hypothetical protein KBE04_09895 [Phycisphaerae bacterium]|nr:hypothetical protein [Phycisphaerae bacterium]